VPQVTQIFSPGVPVYEDDPLDFTREPEWQDLNVLAMHCLRVAESAAANYSQAELARQLKAEWALFIGHTHPPIPGLDSQNDIEAYGKGLKQRMVSFLAGCSVSLFFRAGTGHSF